MKNKLLILMISALILVIIFTGCNDKNRYKNTPLEPVQGLIKIYYFDKGTYKDYMNLFMNKDEVVSKSEFDGYRRKNKPKDVFPSDYENISSVMSHLKVVKQDNNNANVYWLPNAKKDSIDKARLYWIVKKKKDKWYLN